MKDFSIPAVGKWIGAFAIAQWFQIPSVVRLLLVFMTADYVTGLAAAFNRRELSSHAAYKGLVKKSCVLILIGVAHLAEKGAGLDIHVEQGIALAFVVSELISIVENVYRAGVPIPEALVTALLAAKKLQPTATAEQLKALEGEGSK